MNGPILVLCDVRLQVFCLKEPILTDLIVGDSWILILDALVVGFAIQDVRVRRTRNLGWLVDHQALAVRHVGEEQRHRK
jgi:hypothetical protein